MNPSETELTTAATDLLLAILSVWGIAVLLRLRNRDRLKTSIWIFMFSLLGIASVLGAIAHGLAISDETRDLLWKPLNLALGLLVAFFLVGAALDTWGERAARALMPIAVVVGSAFFLYTWLVPGSFLVFVAYKAVVMLVTFALYVRLALRRKDAWPWLMAAGVGLNVVAAAVQQSAAHIRLIWTFDHNGVFHLIQAVAVLVLLAGLVDSMKE